MKCLEIGNERLPNNFGESWHTLDIVGNPTIKHNLIKFPYPIASNTYDIIYMSHVLEHVNWYLSEQVLSELNRILKPKGQLEIWVPDFEKILKAYYLQEIPEKWSVHNPERNVMKWINGRLFSYGEPHNEHKATFDYKYLEYLLKKCNFENIQRLEKPRGISHGYINLGIKGQK